MSKSGLMVIAGVAVVTLLALVYFAATFEAPQGTTTVAIAPPALQPVEPEQVPPTETGSGRGHRAGSAPHPTATGTRTAGSGGRRTHRGAAAGGSDRARARA